MSLSDYVKTECCGTTCDKTGLVDKVKQLESRVEQLQNSLNIAEDIIDELNEEPVNKEELARKCFLAGRRVISLSTTADERAWLNFKATEL